MSTYIIGDVHGHFKTLKALLDVIQYSPAQDQIYLTGDLVNGGNHSAKVVRWAKKNAKIVLGNHDLHMLAVWYADREVRRKDTFADLFKADDCEELVEWLREQPLIRVEENFALVHAGIYPKWGLKKAARLAEETRLQYSGPKPRKWFSRMYGNQPTMWKTAEEPIERFRFVVNACTRMRTVGPKSALDMSFSGMLSQMPENRKPWFAKKETGWSKRVFFGHWAALGLHLNEQVAGLDSGVRWGGPLTAYRLDDGALFQQPRLI